MRWVLIAWLAGCGNESDYSCSTEDYPCTDMRIEIAGPTPETLASVLQCTLGDVCRPPVYFFEASILVVLCDEDSNHVSVSLCGVE